MDLDLPVIDGWEATRRLKSDPATRDIPDHRADGACAWRARARRRSRPAATISIPSRSSSIGCWEKSGSSWGGRVPELPVQAHVIRCDSANSLSFNHRVGRKQRGQVAAGLFQGHSFADLVWRNVSGSRAAISSRYSITSSASASIDGGTARPSGFAALRLMTSSNIAAWVTGRSDGFSPLRMRAT